MDAIAEIATKFDGIIVWLSLVIEIAHYTQVICGVRAEWDKKKIYQQPFATWFMSLACCFGGGFLLHLFTGSPALTPLTNTKSIMLMTIVWWHVFYSPKDSIYSFLKLTPALLVVGFLKEMIRTRKIIKGVKMGNAAYPDSLLICTFLGMLGACGGGFVKNTAIMLRSQWDDQKSSKNFSFSAVTKLCILFSLLYNLQIRSMIPITFEMVVLLQFTIMFLHTASSKFGISFDPFHPFETIITSLTIDYSAFGGSDTEDEEKERRNGKKEQKKAASEKSSEESFKSAKGSSKKASQKKLQ